MLLSAWKTWRLMGEARSSSRWPPEAIRLRQEAGLRALLLHAYHHVPMYRRLYMDAGFRPEAFRSLDDLERVPVLSKRLLADTPPEERVAGGEDPGRCQVVPTSGSSGVPLRVYLGRGDVIWQRVVAWRILFEHGFRWTDRTLEIRMSPGPVYAVQKLGIAPKDWASILDPPESWARCLARRRHEVVVAGAGTLLALAQAVEGLGLRVRQPRIVVSDSETLTDATRDAVYRALGTRPVDVFGLVEVSNFAWECERRQGFHISADSHIVEVGAPPGEMGPLIVTGLGMWTMPVIRYDTGDMAEMGSGPCPCGRTPPILARVHGRRSDAVLLPDGRRLYWPYFHEIMAGFPELRQWRVVQEDLRRIRVSLVVRIGDPGLLDRIRTALSVALPSDVCLHVEAKERISVKPGEKSWAVVCNVPPGLRP
jgi:phenylacetate-CoA ligase